MSWTRTHLPCQHIRLLNRERLWKSRWMKITRQSVTILPTCHIDHCSSMDIGLLTLKPSLWPLTHTGPNPSMISIIICHHYLLDAMYIYYHDECNLIVVIFRMVKGIQLLCLWTSHLALQIIKICLTTVSVLWVLSRTWKTQQCI